MNAVPFIPSRRYKTAKIKPSFISPVKGPTEIAARRQAQEYFRLPILLLLLHAPLGVMLYKLGGLFVLHPLLAIALGLWWAYRRDISLERVAFIIAYIIGAEVLWRMAQAAIFWETGKYAAALIMIVALARRRLLKIPRLPLAYFLLLIPACLPTLLNDDFAEMRNKISFNLSGPFLLFVSCWFSSYLKLDWTEIKKLFFALLVPLASVAAATLFYTTTTADIAFGTQSNRLTSGGFGPNQVSAMLGCGAFLCVMLYLLAKNRLLDNVYLGLLAIAFATQSVLTFSRGGMYNAVGSIFAVVIFLLRRPGQALKNGLQIFALAALFLALIFPYLNDFTGGALQNRFEQTKTTGRTEIIAADVQIFSENPVVGAGIGEGFSEREKYIEHVAASHTEFSRMVAEHGIFGIFAMLALLATMIMNLARQKDTAAKALTAGLFAWSFLFMLNAGMRLAAPSFFLGFTFFSLKQLRGRAVFKLLRRRRKEPEKNRYDG